MRDGGAERPAWVRRALQRFAAALAAVVAGAIVLVVTRGDTGELIGWVLVGLGLTLATVFVFLEVGLSEDRERAGRR